MSVSYNPQKIKTLSKPQVLSVSKDPETKIFENCFRA